MLIVPLLLANLLDLIPALFAIPENAPTAEQPYYLDSRGQNISHEYCPSLACIVGDKIFLMLVRLGHRLQCEIEVDLVRYRKKYSRWDVEIVKFPDLELHRNDEKKTLYKQVLRRDRD